ncbi:MAG: prenyltransferase [Candidatus Dormiibacterota bacterium]
MRSLLVASRPFSWINTCLPFLAAAIATGHGASWPVALGALYFLVPFNLLMYGVNDLFDFESDRRNPRKGGVEGSVMPPAATVRLWLAVGLTNLPLLVILWLLAGPLAGGLLAFTAFTALAYSAPPLRTKVVPGLDAVTSSLHFMLPAACGALVAGATPAGLPWRFLAAFFLWGVASQALGAIQDVDYDREAGLRSIATWLGGSRTAALGVILYVAATLIVASAGGGAVIAGLALLAYPLLPASCLGGDLHRARLAWRGFLGMNLLCGFVLTQVLLHAWGVGPRDALLTIAWGTGAVAWLCCFLGVLGELTLRRLPAAAPPAAGGAPRLSVVVPALGDPSLLAATLRALRAQRYPGELETVVVAGNAADATHGVEGLDGERVLGAATRPPGWTRPAWLCWTGAGAASGRLIAFVEPGARLEPGALAFLAGTLEAEGAGLVSAIARPQLATAVQRCLVPAFTLVQLCLAPIAVLGRRLSWASLAFAPCLVVDAAAYRAAGGHAAIHGSATPEPDLARLLARTGASVRLVRGAACGVAHDLGSGAGIAERWRRTYYAQCGASLPVALCGLFGLPAVTLLPIALAAAALLRGDAAALAGALWGVLALFLLRVLLVWREGHSWRTLLWHPVTFLAVPALLALSVKEELFGPAPAAPAPVAASEPVP